MSEFDNNFFNSQETVISETLPIFKELAIDFDTGEFLIKNNKYVELQKNDAIKVWIWKALKTERNKYLYSSSFGNELYEEVGHIYNREVKQQLIYNEIQETLIVNPYILRVFNFSSEYINSTSTLKVTFSIETLYDTIEEVQKINV